MAAMLAGAGLWVPAAASPDVAVQPKRRYALVIGSNASDTGAGTARREGADAGSAATSGRLKFADSDARLNAEVLELAGYQTTLLASRSRTDDSEEYDPTLEDVEDAIQKVVGLVEKGQGPAEVIFWYSGHGDDNALFLAKNQSLTNAVLAEILLRPLANKPATTVHVIIDACGALAFATGRENMPVVKIKGASDKIVPISAQEKARGLHPEIYRNVGVIVATTLAQTAIEYSALRSGVFSYQLRAALLNGADASSGGQARSARDQKVTYREAEAFVWAANAGVDDDDVRMYVWARGPAADPHRVLIDWTAAGAAAPPDKRPTIVTMSGDDSGQFWVWDADVPNAAHLFRINKGREQTASAGARLVLPPRERYKIGTPDGLIRVITRPTSGTLSWTEIRSTTPLVQNKLKGAALDSGLFRTPYTMEVYATYDGIRSSRGQTSNEVLIKMPGEAAPRSAVKAPLISQQGPPLSPPPRSVGTTPYLLLGGAGVAAISGWLAWREGSNARSNWSNQEQGSDAYAAWGQRTADWDRLATIGAITTGVLVAAGTALFVYRWRRNEIATQRLASPSAGDMATGDLRVFF